MKSYYAVTESKKCLQIMAAIQKAPSSINIPYIKNQLVTFKHDRQIKLLFNQFRR